MEPNVIRQLEWDIQSDALNWWTSTTEVPCTVTIASPVHMEGDSESNDVKSTSIKDVYYTNIRAQETIRARVGRGLMD